MHKSSFPYGTVEMWIKTQRVVIGIHIVLTTDFIQSPKRPNITEIGLSKEGTDFFLFLSCLNLLQ